MTHRALVLLPRWSQPITLEHVTHRSIIHGLGSVTLHETVCDLHSGVIWFSWVSEILSCLRYIWFPPASVILPRVSKCSWNQSHALNNNRFNLTFDDLDPTVLSLYTGILRLVKPQPCSSPPKYCKRGVTFMRCIYLPVCAFQCSGHTTSHNTAERRNTKLQCAKTIQHRHMEGINHHFG